MPPENFRYELAKEAVKGYIDYFDSRAIKTDFSCFVKGDASIFSGFDRDNGKGAAKRILGW
jgi:hypothetical protein